MSRPFGPGLRRSERPSAVLRLRHAQPDRQLREHLAQLLGLRPATYSPRRMTYDLRRPRLHGLSRGTPPRCLKLHSSTPDCREQANVRRSHTKKIAHRGTSLPAPSNLTNGDAILSRSASIAILSAHRKSFSPKLATVFNTKKLLIAYRICCLMNRLQCPDLRHAKPTFSWRWKHNSQDPPPLQETREDGPCPSCRASPSI
jgi:hypothetical protein